MIKKTDENIIIYENNFYNYITGKVDSAIETPNFQLLQVGDAYYLKDIDMPYHRQFFDLEITLAIHNDSFCFANDEKFKIKKNQLFLSFKDEDHKIISKNNFRFQYFAINFKENGNMFSILEVLQTKYKNTNNRVLNIPEISSYITSIISTLSTNDTMFENLFIDSKLTEIIFLLLNFQTDQKQYKFFDKKEMLPTITNYIDNNFLKIASQKELSFNFSYSYTHICKIFKDKHKISIQEYIKNKKMDYAKILILKDKKSISEIANILGYSSLYNFSRAFKNYFKLSPSQFKNNGGAKNADTNM